MKSKITLFLIVLSMSFVLCGKIHAISFNLDSIAQMGKFANFCIKTYRWGDKTFNTYDTTYVEGTGRKFNVKLKNDNWLEFYDFSLTNNLHIRMNSNPSTSFGASISYLAVSVGYDINLSKLINGTNESRNKWNFQFVCALLAADFNYSNSSLGTTITKFGDKNSSNKLNIPFAGVNNVNIGIDAYYFFNNKKYSQAAAYGYSRIQKKSSGSFFGGISIQLQSLDFDFGQLPYELKSKIPSYWPLNSYKLISQNYCLIGGYGYNWVFAPKWLFNISAAPLIGFRYGQVNNEDLEYGLSINARNKFSIVYNNSSKRIFAGLIGKQDLNLYLNSDQAFLSSTLTLNACLGYRF